MDDFVLDVIDTLAVDETENLLVEEIDNLPTDEVEECIRGEISRDVGFEPYKGMEFSTKQAAYDIYNAYGYICAWI